MAQSIQPLPLLYTLFFLYIEPFSTLVGAYYAHFRPEEYMHMTLPSAQTLHPREPVILTQLANLYLLFALNEALVLRATDSRKVWSAFLFGMLVADCGHVFSIKDVAVLEGNWSVYWEFWRWNAMYWGNLGFVYVGATMRTCFLLGVGLPNGNGKGSGKVKAR